MFTGIIEEIGTISSIESQGGKQHFTIKCSKINDDLKLGDSVACNGICLTLIDFTDKSITIEAMNETLKKTTAKTWTIGSSINLERALKFNSRLDGHIVQGHVDIISNVTAIKEVNKTRYIEVSLDNNYAELVVSQGSIAINGVSLTVAKLDTNNFQVALISLTENLTNLSLLKVGDFVNLEFDVIGKYILRNKEVKSNQSKSKISKSWLYEQGF